MSVEDCGPSAIRGWGCTPTGDPPPAAVVSSEDNAKKNCLPTIFSSGWRRTALYGILLCLMFIVFLNVGLTLWIIGALKLSGDGIGPVRIVRGGIQLDGQAWLVDNLVASRITSQTGQPITLHSYRNFTVKVGEPGRLEHSKLFMKRDTVAFRGRALHVRDARGDVVFSAARDEVRVFADALAVDGPGGVSVRSAIQVPHVSAPPASNLTLESLTRRLDLKAPQSIHLESRAGSIDITSHSNIQLNSMVGAIKFDASNLIINHLKEAVPTDKPQKNTRNTKVFQLCVCATGKLFLAAPEAPCAVYEDVTEFCR